MYETNDFPTRCFFNIIQHRPGLDRTQFLLVLFQVRGKFHTQLIFLFFCIYMYIFFKRSCMFLRVGFILAWTKSVRFIRSWY